MTLSPYAKKVTQKILQLLRKFGFACSGSIHRSVGFGRRTKYNENNLSYQSRNGFFVNVVMSAFIKELLACFVGHLSQAWGAEFQIGFKPQIKPQIKSPTKFAHNQFFSLTHIYWCLDFLIYELTSTFEQRWHSQWYTREEFHRNRVIWLLRIKI